jgi:hypothetical protein
MDRYRLAARAYLMYGVIYWLGGVYLAAVIREDSPRDG